VRSADESTRIYHFAIRLIWGQAISPTTSYGGVTRLWRAEKVYSTKLNASNRDGRLADAISTNSEPYGREVAAAQA